MDAATKRLSALPGVVRCGRWDSSVKLYRRDRKRKANAMAGVARLPTAAGRGAEGSAGDFGRLYVVKDGPERMLDLHAHYVMVPPRDRGKVMGVGVKSGGIAGDGKPGPHGDSQSLVGRETVAQNAVTTTRAPANVTNAAATNSDGTGWVALSAGTALEPLLARIHSLRPRIEATVRGWTFRVQDTSAGPTKPSPLRSKRPRIALSIAGLYRSSDSSCRSLLIRLDVGSPVGPGCGEEGTAKGPGSGWRETAYKSGRACLAAALPDCAAALVGPTFASTATGGAAGHSGVALAPAAVLGPGKGGLGRAEQLVQAFTIML